MLKNRLSFTKNTEEEIKKISNVLIENIRPNPYQPRKQFNKKALMELSDSIKQYGIIQPVTIRRMSPGIYELIAGERRIKAAALAGIRAVPAIIVNAGDNDSAVMALIENLQREDLNYLEEAECYNNLISDYDFTQEGLAEKIGKSQSTIANKIRLLKLPPIVKKMLVDNKLTERHARALLKLHKEQMQLKVLKYVCDKGLNVKRTEELIEKVINKYYRGYDKKNYGKISKSIRDVRIFINTIKQAIDLMKKSGVDARAAQLDRGAYIEFIVRVPKKSSKKKVVGES